MPPAALSGSVLRKLLPLYRIRAIRIEQGGHIAEHIGKRAVLLLKRILVANERPFAIPANVSP